MSEIIKNGKDEISISIAFDAMRLFLKRYWELGDKTSDDIATLLGSLNRQTGTEFYPLDIALWHDWVSSIEEVSRGLEV